MRLYNKSLLMNGDNYVYEESSLVNRYKAKLTIDNNYLSSYVVKFNTNEMDIDYINKMLENDELFNIIYEYFESDSCPMNISLISNNRVNNYYLYKRNFIETINEMINNNLISDKYKDKINSLSSLITLDKLKETTNNKKYTIKVNDNYVNCPYNLIYNFLECSDVEFENYFKDDSLYNDYNKKLFLYIINKFYTEYSDGFILGDKIKERIKFINSQKDLEFVKYEKKFVSNKDKQYSDLIIDKELEEKLLTNMPNDLTKLEQALYLYIKLCKIFNYDLEYYAVRQKGPLADSHRDINKASLINLKNKNVVCYEFNAIFAKLLSKFDIDFEIRQTGEKYGSSHAWLRVNIEDMLLSFDSIHRIFWEMDLLEAKLNNPLKGIKLYNKNETIINEFNNSLNKIYNIINEEENDKSNISNKYDEYFNDINIDDNPYNILNNIVNEVETKHLYDMESIGYVLNLLKKYNSLDKKYKIEYELLIKRINKELSLSLLFITYNKYDKEKEYTYYLYTPCEILRKIDKESIEFYLEQKIFEVYDKNNDVKIKGLDYVSKKEIDLNMGRVK